jgi:predicted porin/outer membrane murein-binding lipoprotein Lpp
MMQKPMALPLMVAMAVFLGAWANPGSAQTLDELKAQVREMSKRLQELEAKQEQLEEKADEVGVDTRNVISGKQGVKLTVSGQVNRGLLYVDNGDKDDLFHVDNDNSSTRVRFVGVGALTEDITVGSQIEVQFESNSTASIRIDQDGAAGPNNFTERKLELYVDSQRFGRLWLGQGDTASNGTSEVDLSGTSVVAYSGIGDMAGGIAFSDNNVLGPRIGQVFSNFDGLSRDDRIRYDTPSFSGFKGSVSALEGGAVDVGLRFSGEISGTKVVAAAAWADASSKDSNNFKQYNGSVSVLTPIGISVTGAVGSRDLDSGTGDDPLFYYGKLGYTFDAISFGSTSIGVDYEAVDDLNQDGDEAQTYGVFAVQRYDKIGAELYLGARNHELDRPGSNFDDVLAVIIGGKVRF